MSYKPKRLILERVCAAHRFASISSPLVVSKDEDDGCKILCLDEKALRISMGSQSVVRKKTYSSLNMEGSASMPSQFNPDVYGCVDYEIVVLPAGLASSKTKAAPTVDLKLWVHVKSSDTDSLFISVNGSDFMSWHINFSDEFSWRKFWKNIPLTAGTHTITLGLKYPQLYVANVWIGSGSFQPLAEEDFNKVRSSEEEEGSEVSKRKDSKKKPHKKRRSAAVDEVGSSGPSDTDGDEVSQSQEESVSDRFSGRSGRRRGRHNTRRSAGSSLGVNEGMLDPEIAKYYIGGLGAGETSDEQPDANGKSDDPDFISGSYEQYAKATAPKPRKKTKKKKKKKPERDYLYRNELSTFSFNAGSRPTTPMRHGRTPDKFRSRPRTLQDYMARSSFQERKVLREHDRKRLEMVRKKRDIARFATFQVLSKGFEIDLAFRFKQRERSVEQKQKQRALEKAQQALLKEVTADDTINDPLDTLVEGDETGKKQDPEGEVGNDDREKQHKANLDQLENEGESAGAGSKNLYDEGEAQGEVATDTSERNDDVDGGNAESGSDEDDHSQDNILDAASELRKREAVEATLKRVKARPFSAPAGETVFGRKYYTEDQIHRQQLRALPPTITSVLAANAHRRTSFQRTEMIEMPKLAERAERDRNVRRSPRR